MNNQKTKIGAIPCLKLPKPKPLEKGRRKLDRIKNAIDSTNWSSVLQHLITVSKKFSIPGWSVSTQVEDKHPFT